MSTDDIGPITFVLAYLVVVLFGVWCAISLAVDYWKKR